MYGWRRRIGLIVPSSNTTMESEFWRLVPAGISVHTARVRLVRVNTDGLRRMVGEVVKAAEDLATAGVDIIIFGCTSGALLEGLSWESSLREQIEGVVGLRTVTAAEAAIKALRVLGVKRVAVATPYIDEINQRERAFLEAAGFEVANIRGLGLVNNLEIGSQPPWVTYKLALEVSRGVPVDGIFISCTNLRTIEVVNALEEELGLPVVSSNTACLWLVLRTMGIRDSVGCGKLLREVRHSAG